MRNIPEKLRGWLLAGHRGVMCAEKVDAARPLGSSTQQMFMDRVLVRKPQREGGRRAKEWTLPAGGSQTGEGASFFPTPTRE